MNLPLPMAPPQYQSRDDLHATIQNLADEPNLANGPPGYQRRDALADEPSSANGPTLVPEQRWLAYQYTKLGRWTYFGQWIPPLLEQTWLSYQHTQLRRWTYFGQQNPPGPEQRCLACHYTKLGRWTYFGWWTPQDQSRDDMHTTTQNLADEPTLGQWNPQYQSRDALNTSTQNLAEEPTLADGPPRTRVEMPCIPVHKTWQMNLLWPMDPQGNRAEMPSHCYWHLLVKNGNFTLWLTFSGQEWQFHIATDIYWSGMALSHCYWHLVVKNGNFTLLTSSGQEWQLADLL